jgi:transcriptional regulator GlxA family with amidase domain
MAEECGFSTSYFIKKFKEQTGEKHIDVLTDIRIREAQRLLATTNLSVAEIVEAVGYCDDKHFRRLFQKLTGLNPLEYRKKIQGEKEILMLEIEMAKASKND